MGREATQFKKGERLTGRTQGSRNRVSAGLRDTFLAVFEELQEDEDCNLKEWARENPTEFYRLVSRLLPQEYTGEFYTVIEVNMKDEEEQPHISTPRINLLPDGGSKENDFG